GIHARHPLQTTHPVAKILDLVERKNLPARLALAFAKASIVDCQHHIACSGEELALINQRFLALSRAVTEHYAGIFTCGIKTLGRVQVSCAVQSAALERDKGWHVILSIDNGQTPLALRGADRDQHRVLSHEGRWADVRSQLSPHG